MRFRKSQPVVPDMFYYIKQKGPVKEIVRKRELFGIGEDWKYAAFSTGVLQRCEVYVYGHMKGVIIERRSAVSTADIESRSRGETGYKHVDDKASADVPPVRFFNFASACS